MRNSFDGSVALLWIPEQTLSFHRSLYATVAYPVIAFRVSFVRPRQRGSSLRFERRLVSFAVIRRHCAFAMCGPGLVLGPFSKFEASATGLQSQPSLQDPFVGRPHTAFLLLTRYSAFDVERQGSLYTCTVMASPTDDSEQDSSFSTPSAPPSSRTPLHRSVSHTSQWSVADTPQHHNLGTSYSTQHPRPVSPSPRRHPGLVRSLSSSVTRRNGVRSASTSSRHGRRFRDDSDMLSGDEGSSEDEGSRSGLEGNRGKAAAIDGENGGDADEDGEGEEDIDEDPITLKDRQSLINVEHPFGLPIWKPALYKKSRSVTRYADQALHSVPSAQAERHLLVGNIFWTIAFGWWLACICFAISGILFVLPYGGRQYSSLLFGLGWYLGWPFGKYVEGDFDEDRFAEDASDANHTVEVPRTHASSDGDTVRASPPSKGRRVDTSPIRHPEHTTGYPPGARPFSLMDRPTQSYRSDFVAPGLESRRAPPQDPQSPTEQLPPIHTRHRRPRKHRLQENGWERPYSGWPSSLLSRP